MAGANRDGHHHQPMLWPVHAAPVMAAINGPRAVTACRKRSKGSGRFFTVRSPRMVRVGRQDHGSPIWPQRTPPLGQVRARQPFPNSREPATHRPSEEKMRLAAGNVGQEWAEKDENLVFALRENCLPELAGARAYRASCVTVAFVAAPLLHGLLNVGLPLRHQLACINLATDFNP
jgi:hypothetical protein